MVIFLINPDIMRILVLLTSVTGTDTNLLTHTLAYMDEEEHISQTVLGKLCEKLVDEAANAISESKVRIYSAMRCDIACDVWRC